jgi:hypothetical protein
MAWHWNSDPISRTYILGAMTGREFAASDATDKSRRSRDADGDRRRSNAKARLAT